MDAKDILFTELLAIRKKYEHSADYFLQKDTESGNNLWRYQHANQKAEEVKRGIDQLLELVSDRDFRIFDSSS